MLIMDKETEFMRLALEEAKKAYDCSEVPVGAIVVKDGVVISAAYNRRENDGVATAHAELLAIEEACKRLGGWRLSGCTLYVTLEPCPMCAGAIINSRIDRVVYGASDSVAGCLGSVINFNLYPFNHAFEIKHGVLEAECVELLKSFFDNKRQEKRNTKI